MGGVGQHVCEYLITNGVTNLTILDFDVVELSNLNRQILLEEKDVGLPKVEVVIEALLKRNSDAQIKTINIKFIERNALDLVNGYDVIVDAVDNWETKLIIADACKKKNIPLLHIGVDGYRGQYCLFKNKSLRDVVTEEVLSAPKDGVMGPMVGAISSLATLLLISYLLGDFSNIDQINYFDYQTSHFTKVLI